MHLNNNFTYRYSLNVFQFDANVWIYSASKHSHETTTKMFKKRHKTIDRSVIDNSCPWKIHIAVRCIGFSSGWHFSQHMEWKFKRAIWNPIGHAATAARSAVERKRERACERKRGKELWKKRIPRTRQLAKLGDANRQAADTVGFTTHRTSSLKYAHNSRIIVSIPEAPYRGQTRSQHSLPPQSRNSSVDFADNADTRAPYRASYEQSFSYI